MTCLIPVQNTPTEPARTVEIVLPNDAPPGAPRMILDVFDTVNDLISGVSYGVQLRRLSETRPCHQKPMHRHTAIFLGDIRGRWSPVGTEKARAAHILNTASRCVLIGGAVFLLEDHRTGDLAVHPNFVAAAREELTEGTIVPDRHARSGRIASAISGFAALPLLIDLIRDDHGPFIAGAVSDYLGLSEGLTPARSKAALRIQRRAHGDHLIAAVLELMQTHIEEPLQIRELARDLGVSTRKLERRFQDCTGVSPLSAYRSLRMERVHQLLVHTSLPLSEITVATGFGSSSTLSQWCRKSFGLSPKELRHQSYEQAATPLLAAE